MRRSSPPALACWLLKSVLPVPYRDAMLGDLVEEYSLRVESTSRSAATRWFWSQACRSIPFMVVSSLRSADWLMSLRIATGVYVVMGMIKVAAELIISKLVAPELPVRVVLAAIVFLATTSIAGWVAARIRPGSTIFLALIVMITVAVLTAVKICAVPVAWWYPFGFLTLGPLSVLFTPAVFARRSRCRWLSGKSSGGGATRKQNWSAHSGW
jgi:hypothetical protein